MTRPLSRIIPIVAGMLLVCGCTATPAPDESVTPSPAAITLPSDSEIAEYLAVSCADVISPELAQTLHTAGWAAKESVVWVVGETTFDDGGLCEWTGGAGDPVQFGWARADAGQIAAVQEYLGAEGWSSRDDAGVTVFTAPAGTKTFLFGADDTVRFGTTRDGAGAVTLPAT